MRITLHILTTVAGAVSLVFAQGTTTTTALVPATSTCQAAYVVDQCLLTQQERLSECNDGDYGCRCGVYGDYVTCFNNCPSDPRVQTYTAQQTQFCALASQYPSFVSTTATITATSIAVSENGTLIASPTDTEGVTASLHSILPTGSEGGSGTGTGLATATSGVGEATVTATATETSSGTSTGSGTGTGASASASSTGSSSTNEVGRGASLLALVGALVIAVL